MKKEFSKFFNCDFNIEKMNVGLTNNNYKISLISGDKYVLKQYSKIIKNNEPSINHLVTNFDVETYLINENVKITKFVEFGEINHKNINKEKIVEIANILKQLHQKKIISNIEINPFNEYQGYLKNIKTYFINYKNLLYLVDKAKTIFKNQKAILCHNDLVLANFLKTKTKLYLIDWEYSGNNNPYFDVVNFLVENGLFHSKWKEIFLKSYFENELIPYEEIEIWGNYQSLMFLAWANMFYEKTNKKVYLDIGLFLFNQLQKGINQKITFTPY